MYYQELHKLNYCQSTIFIIIMQWHHKATMCEQGLIAKKCIAMHTIFKFKLALYSCVLVINLFNNIKIIIVKLKPIAFFTTCSIFHWSIPSCCYCCVVELPSSVASSASPLFFWLPFRTCYATIIKCHIKKLKGKP